jgi:very-short-patch-repair endonuclease
MTSEPRVFARALRRRQTTTEDLLWQQLRGGRCDGRKFRRQVPIAGYVVDFLCVSAKLIIEVDGQQHAWEADYDAARSRTLEEMGFTVLRVANEEVRDHLDQVLSRIVRELRPGRR